MYLKNVSQCIKLISEQAWFPFFPPYLRFLVHIVNFNWESLARTTRM